MRKYFDIIDTLRVPPAYADQLLDAVLTFFILTILFAVIAGLSWMAVKIWERRENRMAVLRRVL